MNWEEILLSVEKPSRYLGTEVNAVKKDHGGCKLLFALAFPDSYEVGMSHLGLQILYSILNAMPDAAAERCYAPWPDMERHLREEKIALGSLESQTPLNRFDAVGFSLQYELSYTNVLNMLELGGIPIRGSERGGDHPIIIAGGPCVFNPAPMAQFIDAFVIGEGEEVIIEIAKAMKEQKKKGAGRRDLLEALSAVAGVYVPQVHTGGEVIKKRTIRDINSAPFPEKPLVPLMKTIHDRVTLEIARGCTRGCRFCQAGMVWRPVRERDVSVLENMAERMLRSTGCDELSLLSLSTGDYSKIETLFILLADRYAEQKVALALPSMRVETLTQRMMEEIKRVRKTSFTLAPEAGTQRLRDVINKGNTEEDLLTTTRQVFAAGWKSLKLYFMIGLPSETQEDLEGIVDLAYKCLREARTRGQITVSLSTFVPKAHTPFQWQRQISMEETQEKQAFFRKRLRHRLIKVKWHDSRMSYLEGILSRGDERLGALLEKAYRLGCRFDGWSDRFRFDLWEKAMAEIGVDADEYLRERDVTESLSWDNIDTGVAKDFLKIEAENSLVGCLTEDCRVSACSDCGVCDERNIRICNAKEGVAGNEPQIVPKDEAPPQGQKRLRIIFKKRNKARFLSHLELSTALIRAINRSRLNFIFSQGFHPHAKISFSFATPVGMESDAEYAEMHVQDSGFASGASVLPGIVREINDLLPDGLRVISLYEVPPDAPSLSGIIKGFQYVLAGPKSVFKSQAAQMRDKASQILQSEEFNIEKTGKGGTILKNIRPFVEGLSVNEEKGTIELSVLLDQSGGSVRAADVLTAVLDIDDETAKMFRILKTKTCLVE